MGSYGQVVKPPPLHGGVTSSMLGSANNYMPSVRVGEGAALKAVGLKGLAGSNPVDGASRRKTINPLEKFRTKPPNVNI